MLNKVPPPKNVCFPGPKARAPFEGYQAHCVQKNKNAARWRAAQPFSMSKHYVPPLSVRRPPQPTVMKREPSYPNACPEIKSADPVRLGGLYPPCCVSLSSVLTTCTRPPLIPPLFRSTRGRPSGVWQQDISTCSGTSVVSRADQDAIVVYSWLQLEGAVMECS